MAFSSLTSVFDFKRSYDALQPLCGDYFVQLLSSTIVCNFVHKCDVIFSHSVQYLSLTIKLNNLTISYNHRVQLFSLTLSIRATNYTTFPTLQRLFVWAYYCKFIYVVTQFFHIIVIYYPKYGVCYRDCR